MELYVTVSTTGGVKIIKIVKEEHSGENGDLNRRASRRWTALQEGQGYGFPPYFLLL